MVPQKKLGWHFLNKGTPGLPILILVFQTPLKKSLLILMYCQTIHRFLPKIFAYLAFHVSRTEFHSISNVAKGFTVGDPFEILRN